MQPIGWQGFGVRNFPELYGALWFRSAKISAICQGCGVYFKAMTLVMFPQLRTILDFLIVIILFFRSVPLDK